MVKQGRSHSRNGMMRVGASTCARLIAALVAMAPWGCSDDESVSPPVGGTGGVAGFGGEFTGGGGGASGVGGSSGGNGGTGGVAGTGPGGAGGSAQNPLPAEKWIPSFVVKYANASTSQPTAETANFDLLITGPAHRQIWAETGNSWETLKSYNPDMRIMLYVLGPSEFNTSTWAVLANQWDFVTTNHGLGTADPWPCAGYRNPDRMLYNDAYSNERIMDLGNAAWRQFYYEQVYDALFGSTGDHVGADGLFSDVTGYDVPYVGRWRVEDGPNADQPDDPAPYYDGADYDHDLHRSQMNSFFDEAIPWFAAQNPPVTFTNNFTSTTNPDQWSEVDQRTNRPYASMSEAGSVQPYGAYTFGVFNFQDRLDTVRSLQNVKLINMCHGKSGDLSGDGLARMDSAGTTGPGDGATTMTGWEALWFGMCAHMAAISPQRDNAYFGFTVWSYSEYHWFDELDPAYIHLGDAVADAFEQGGATYREFEDGWVACNGTTGDLTGLTVPTGEARVVNHGNFMTPDSATLETTFDLPLHRGVILLKDGHNLGNQG